MDTLDKYTKISDDFSYSTSCMESFPCQHRVKINGEVKCWDIQTIYQYLKKNKLEIPRHVAYENNIISTGNYGNNWDGHS